MKDRGKSVEVYSNDFVQDYSTSSDLPCKRHPQSSSVGICAYCLKDRLVKLVCTDCGEQRLSSCSCSDEISSNPRTSCTGEVGSVGRVSFLIENENKDLVLLNPSSNKPKSNSGSDKSEEVFFLKRSNSSCFEIKNKNGFWRIGRLFRKKRDKRSCGKSVGGINEKSDLWVVDYNGVSRSRSLCSFRGGGFFGSEDGGDLTNFSGARSSSISAARSSSVCFDPDRKSGFSEAEPRKSGFDSDRRDSTYVESDVADIKSMKKPGGLLDLDAGFNTANRRVFSLKESYFTGGDDSGFIDLKFEFQSESKGDIHTPAMKKGVLSDSNSAFGSMRGAADFVPHECGSSIHNALVGDGVFCNGGSCRITVNERGIKRSRKSFKGWRWIFKHNPDRSSSRKKGGDLMVNH